ncbi:MAG: hypothetical protein COA90_04145 [Gammaproteobacteria bacterium]|nr:MAG: hypothetical protein COA90_04145 [Gammaproteobacteria bacterium]
MRIVNGWYIFQPNKNCPILALDVRQIVQVIEGVVWITRVDDEWDVEAVKACGTFEKRIKV